jgi:hypothetical protein
MQKNTKTYKKYKNIQKDIKIDKTSWQVGGVYGIIFFGNEDNIMPKKAFREVFNETTKRSYRFKKARIYGSG